MVPALGVDEHSYLAATPAHQTIYATSLVDLDRRPVIDLFEDGTGRTDMRSDPLHCQCTSDTMTITRMTKIAIPINARIM